MNETLLLGIGILLCLAVWKYAVKPTYLDEARDSLFDLRDSKLKPFFGNTENGLNDPLYIKMRGLINDLLRYTERATLVGFLITVITLAKHGKSLQKISRNHERTFESEDSRVTDFCRDIRSQANMIMMRYMIRTSVLGQIIRVIGYTVIFTRMMINSLRTCHKPIWVATCATATGAALVSNVVTHVAPGMSSTTAQNAFEARAMRQI